MVELFGFNPNRGLIITVLVALNAFFFNRITGIGNKVENNPRNILWVDLHLVDLLVVGLFDINVKFFAGSAFTLIGKVDGAVEERAVR